MNTPTIGSNQSHLFQLSANQAPKSYGDPATLVEHLRPHYPSGSHEAGLPNLYDFVHWEHMRGDLKADHIAAIRRHLRTARADYGKVTLQIAPLTLITAEDVRVKDGNGIEAGKIVSQVLKLLRHRLGVESTTLAGKAAEFFMNRTQGAHFNAARIGLLDTIYLQQTLANALIGLSFQAAHLDQATVDKNIDAFHAVLTRNHAKDKPGLGGKLNVQAKVIETMLTVGIEPKMEKCKSHAIRWIKSIKFSSLEPIVGFRLAKTCLRLLQRYCNDDLPSCFWRVDKEFLKKLSHEQRAELKSDIKTALTGETRSFITMPMKDVLLDIGIVNSLPEKTPLRSSLHKNASSGFRVNRFSERDALWPKGSTSTYRALKGDMSRSPEHRRRSPESDEPLDSASKGNADRMVIFGGVQVIEIEQVGKGEKYAKTNRAKAGGESDT